MKTIELMSTAPRTVRVVDRLDAAARAMWEGDCGLIPVVDADGTLAGVITDRDLCMASYTQGRALGEIPVATVMAKKVTVCRSDDAVVDVMQRMQQLRVHRLPVVDARNALVGVISTNDLVRAAHARPAAVDPVAVVRTLAAIGAPRSLAVAPAAAARPVVAAAAPAEVPAVKPAPVRRPAERKSAKTGGVAREAAKAPSTRRTRKS